MNIAMSYGCVNLFYWEYFCQVLRLKPIQRITTGFPALLLSLDGGIMIIL